jgi:ABC-2 type transport system permease protein
MRQAMRAEWAKTWSGPVTAWVLGGLLVVSLAVSAVTIGTARCAATGCGQDPARLSLAGVYLGQAVAALAGVLAIGGEYGTGMISVTLAAIPRRGRVLAAKALVLAGPVLAASVLAAGTCLLAAVLVLPGHGFTSAHGFDLAGPAMWRAACCAALYLALVALLGLGVATVVRDPAVATGAVLGLLYLLPVIGLAASHTVQRLLEQTGPMSAGIDSLSDVPGLPLTPWQGLGVVALWAAGALVLACYSLRTRDA